MPVLPVSGSAYSAGFIGPDCFGLPNEELLLTMEKSLSVAGFPALQERELSLTVRLKQRTSKPTEAMTADLGVRSDTGQAGR